MHASFSIANSHSRSATPHLLCQQQLSAMAASKLQFTSCCVPIQGNEINFSKLYLHHTPAGPRPNQSEVTSNNGETGLGPLVVNSWPVYDGIGSDAKVVANAQGLHVYAGHWHNSFSLVFQDERFKGSTLEVMGIVVEEGEWAIVGGTGQFAMATGNIFKTFHKQNEEGNIVELSIHGFCPLFKRSQSLPIKIGTWGGNAGKPQDITETPKRLERITIYSNACVDSISFTYFDHAGQKHIAGPWGGPGGNPSTIEFSGSEFLKEVSGTFGSYEGWDVIRSIKFVTNQKTYGPFGRQDIGTAFSVPVQNNYGVVAFFGRGGKYLDAVGVYVHPI